MTAGKEFNDAIELLKTFTKRPKDEEFLEIYGLYKQATFGDNNTAKPSMFDRKAKYKWEFWSKHKGKSQEEAEKLYVELIKKLSLKYK